MINTLISTIFNDAVANSNSKNILELPPLLKLLLTNNKTEIYKFITTRENSRPKIDTGKSEFTCTGPQLRGHIVKVHFQAGILAWYGVPLYDVEVAQFRGFDLNWVVKKAYERLEQTDTSIQAEISDIVKNNPLTPSTPHDYRTVLVKTLILISQKGLATVDWGRVEHAFPGASQVTLDLKTDTIGESFFESAIYRRATGFSGRKIA